MRRLTVGAGHGTFSLYAAGLGHSVVAYEPVSGFAEAINKSAGLNGVAERVQVRQDFVLDQHTAVFKDGVVTKAAVRLDAELQGRVPLLRVSTQAYEFLVLRSASHAFRERRVGNVVVELMARQSLLPARGSVSAIPSSSGDTVSFLVRLGFEPWLVKSPCMQELGVQVTKHDQAVWFTTLVHGTLSPSAYSRPLRYCSSAYAG